MKQIFFRPLVEDGKHVKRRANYGEWFRDDDEIRKWDVEECSSRSEFFIYTRHDSTMRTEEEVSEKKALYEKRELPRNGAWIDGFIEALEWVLNEGESEKGEKS